MKKLEGKQISEKRLIKITSGKMYSSLEIPKLGGSVFPFEMSSYIEDMAQNAKLKAVSLTCNIYTLYTSNIESLQLCLSRKKRDGSNLSGTTTKKRQKQ